MSIFVILLVASERECSPTADEPLHLVRGLSFWWEDDTRLLYAHPPLANAVQAFAPAKDEAEPPDLSSVVGWGEADVLETSSNYFQLDYARAREQMQRARDATILWSLVFSIFLYLWCLRRYGPVTALVALGFYVLHPTVIAHSALATTDAPLAAAAFVAIAAHQEYVQKRSGWALGGYALAVATMCVIKHTGLGLFTVLTILSAAAAWRGWGRFEAAPRWQGLKRVGWDAVVVTLVIVLAINLVYRFEGTCMSVEEILAEAEPQSWISKQFGYDIIRDSPILAFVPSWVVLPLPYDYFAGLVTVRMQNALGHGDYFAGFRYVGHPLYFTVMLLIKTPVGMLAALGFGIREFYRRRFRVSRTTFLLVAFAVVYLAIASTSRINIGVRHILPIFPVLCVLAGRACTLLMDAYAARGRLVAVGLVTLTGCGTIVVFPNYIGDFNALTLGRRLGLKISVIGEEWGQDVGTLAEVVQEEELEPLFYSTRYSVRRYELDYQGVRYIPLDCEEEPDRPGWVAVDLTRWVRTEGECFSTWLEERPPDRTINGHILMWQIPDDIVEIRANLEKERKDEEVAIQKGVKAWRRYLRKHFGIRLPAPADERRKKGKKTPKPAKPKPAEEPL